MAVLLGGQHFQTLQYITTNPEHKKKLNLYICLRPCSSLIPRHKGHKVSDFMLHFVKKTCEDSLSLKRDKISIRGQETENMFE